MNYSENAKTYPEYSWELKTIILRRPCLERALCACKASTWSVRRAPEEGWAASPHTDFSAADLRAGPNTEFGPGAPGPAPIALSPQHRAPLDSFLPPPLPLPPKPQPRIGGGGGWQEAVVSGPPLALLKASQAWPRRGIPAEEGAAR